MKKVLILCLTALMLSTTASFAQKVNATAIKEKLAKLDADTEHAKKSLKASTWVARGNGYLDAMTATTKALYIGAEKLTIDLLTGKTITKSTKKTFGNTEYDVFVYPYFSAYVANGKLASWTPKSPIDPKAYNKVIESYNKAMEIDPSGAAKSVKEGLQQLIDYYKQQGELSLTLFDMVKGADAFMKVADIQKNPAYNKVDPQTLFYAGYMYAMSGNKDKSAFTKGEKTLNRAIKEGYEAFEDADTTVVESDRGNIYYYLFHCAYGVKDENPSKITDAANYLKAGLAKYPRNERVFEGLLQLYTSDDKAGDPKELLSYIDSNIEANPTNINSWFGRGRIYYALKDYDECIASFQKVTEIDPSIFDGQYYLGLFYMLKGDDFLQTMNKTTYTDQASYDVDVKELSKYYLAAIPAFEKAHELKPTDPSTVEYLKQLCFRLREEPGVMEKYTKYNELFKSMQQ